ncbi:hypothetical protein ACU5AY_01975 [Rhizobium sp. PAMB 3174]
MYARIASILTAMKAASILEERFRLLKRHEYLEKLHAGELEGEQAQKKLLDAYAEELSVKRLEWANIQVSLVAGGPDYTETRTFSQSSGDWLTCNHQTQTKNRGWCYDFH